MKTPKRESERTGIEEDDCFWSEGSFVQSMSKEEMEKKNRTIHMKNNEEMNYNCKKCKVKISAHNEDWHGGMCDRCFNEMMDDGCRETGMKGILHGLIGKKNKDVERQFGFGFYLETKDGFLLGRDIDHKTFVDSFLTFNNGRELIVVEFYDGVLQDIVEMDSGDIKKNLYLLGEEKGLFYDDGDDELATAYGFICEDYLAEIMEGIIFFSGKEDAVNSFARVLDNRGVEHFEPRPIAVFDAPLHSFKTVKLGRNEPCHCESGKKYKKCCLDSDIESTGKPKRVRL